MKVELSDGTVVTLKDEWTHGTQKAFDAEVYAQGEAASVRSLHAAWEKVLLEVMVLAVERNGSTVEPTAAWLESLPERDYQKVRKAADALAGDDEASKKNPE